MYLSIGIALGILFSWALMGPHRAEQRRAAELRVAAIPSEIRRHRSALRYFLRRQTTIGCYEGEHTLDDVKEAIAFFASAELTRLAADDDSPPRASAVVEGEGRRG